MITGASGGIGTEIARAFAREGARIVLSARNIPALESLAAELRAGGTGTMIVPSDVTSAGDMQTLVRDAVASFGAIDILVCNAGVYVRGAVRGPLHGEHPPLHGNELLRGSAAHP